jgi:hypothetical protein
VIAVNDLEGCIRGVLRAQLPFLESASVDRLTNALTAGIASRFPHSIPLPLTRAELVDRLAVERHLPVPPGRPLGASLPNMDTPDVVARRLEILREMPADDVLEGDEPCD